jgi:glycosyltransferase involved in cell wall biosynthesis
VSALAGVRRATRPLTELGLRGVVTARTRGWAPASHLFVVGDTSGWSIDDDAVQISAIARRLGCDVAPAGWARHARRQSVFLPSHFTGLTSRWLESSHRLGISYFHGRPGTAGAPEFDQVFEALQRHAGRVDRVHVTHAEMEDVVTAAGVDRARVFRIPIGIDLEHFPLVDADARRRARAALALPMDAFVLGSFQKDGVGWGAGLEPKRVKGPDVLVAVAERVRSSVSELVVLLTGPARGYVMQELSERGIAYRHALIEGRDRFARAYHALDAYLVPSRQEGGPKSVLESLATGTPLVSTRVGQAPEIVEHERTALLADVDDADALAGYVLRIHDDTRLAASLRTFGRERAEAYAYEHLDLRWDALLEGFVTRAT